MKNRLQKILEKPYGKVGGGGHPSPLLRPRVNYSVKLFYLFLCPVNFQIQDTNNSNTKDCLLLVLFFLANQLISEGVIAIIGPETSTAVKATYSLCTKFNIPQISASATDPDFFYNWNRYKFLLRMSPTDTSMSFAMRDLIEHFKWKRMGILTSATDYGKMTYSTCAATYIFTTNCAMKSQADSLRERPLFIVPDR